MDSGSSLGELSDGVPPVRAFTVDEALSAPRAVVAEQFDAAMARAGAETAAGGADPLARGGPSIPKGGWGVPDALRDALGGEGGLDKVR